MVRAGVLLLASMFVFPVAGADLRMGEILDRLSEEAEVFRTLAPNIVGRETLRHKARKDPGIFRFRVGSGALEPPDPEYQSREVISEYGFSYLEEAPEALLELRQIISVDGRDVAGHKRARQTLTLGIKNNDDRAKKKMLRRFEKSGLRGAATDFGQVILLFLRRNLDKYQFVDAGTRRIGADEAVVLQFSQRQGPEAFTIFQGREATHARLEGEIYVRASDYTPLRISMRTTVDDGEHVTLHLGSVDYFQSGYGVLLPATVSYRETVEGGLLVENVASYSDFQMFAVDAEIKFTFAEEPTGTPPSGPAGP
jgi:hypothetical protein